VSYRLCGGIPAPQPYHGYRYYNPDTLDFTAEINVAKHRNGRTGMVKLYFHEASTGFKALAREGV
jgi:replicative DNA helicase